MTVEILYVSDHGKAWWCPVTNKFAHVVTKFARDEM